MIVKLKKCPKCKMKPHYMAINNYSGYLTCIGCHSSTFTFESDNYDCWKTKARNFWNKTIEGEMK